MEFVKLFSFTRISVNSSKWKCKKVQLLKLSKMEFLDILNMYHNGITNEFNIRNWDSKNLKLYVKEMGNEAQNPHFK